MFNKIIFFTSLCLLAILGVMAGCQSQQAEPSGGLDPQLQTLIQLHGITGKPTASLPVSDIDSPLAQLGKELFFTKALGGQQDVACVSCHHPWLGGGDRLAIPIGVDAVNPNFLGPGRQQQGSEFELPRNSPTVFNSAFWQRRLFWDSRLELLPSGGVRTPESRYGQADVKVPADLLTAQGFFPVTSKFEMRGEDFEYGRANDAVRLHLVARMGGYGAGKNELITNPWPKKLQAVFPGHSSAEPTEQYLHIATALSAYQRSQVFIDSPWRRYVAGDKQALSAKAKQGAVLFYSAVADGGAGCVACHSGDFFTDEEHYALGVPQIGPGKNNGEDWDDDYGRARETLNKADMYKYRTPTLLNVAVTDPYYHNGAAATLLEVIEQHVAPLEYATQYFANQTWCEIAPFQQHAECESLFPNAQSNTQQALAMLPTDRQQPSLTQAQKHSLVSFLQALTDPCVTNKACLQPWLLSEAQQNDLSLQPDITMDVLVE